MNRKLIANPTKFCPEFKFQIMRYSDTTNEPKLLLIHLLIAIKSSIDLTRVDLNKHQKTLT